MNHLDVYHLSLLDEDSNYYGWPNRLSFLARIDDGESYDCDQDLEDKKLLENKYIPMSNSKEEKNMDVNGMTKEQALEAIEKLKVYVEECNKKEIPKMQTNCLRDINQCEIKAGACSNFNRYLTFENQDTNNIWAFVLSRIFKG